MLDDTNSSVGGRGLPGFRHSEPIEHGLLSDRQPLLSTTLVAVQKPRHPRLMAVGVLAVVAALAVAIVSLIVRNRAVVPVLTKTAVCSTDDCIEHARHLIATLNTSMDPCHGKAQLRDGAISELRSDESAIRNVVLSTDDPDEHDDWLAAHDPDLEWNVSADEWMALVSKYLAASGFSAAPNVGILVVQRQRLKALALALNRVPPDRLLRVVGWTLAYAYAWIVDPALDTFEEWGAASSSEDFTSHALCFLAVHESHGITMSRECRVSKANTSAEQRFLTDLFALDLSLVAMNSAAAVDESPLQLKSLEGLSVTQTFYVSYCSHFCEEQPLSQARAMCNLAANASAFAQAFSCRVSGVTTHKCLFF
ncbi:hypothetical protein V5799_022106 [Amblyomma americanum]|uniref:Uncharacterized protein n=1 Tax=Amblyomma americanum TaxID=6943 RepID=A0AAQ4FNI2_AMBAM